MKNKNQTTLLLISALLFMACAEKRPIKHVLPEASRMDKSFFSDGEFYANVTAVAISPNAPIGHIGDQSFGNNSLVKFEIGEKNITVKLVDPRYKDKTSLKEPIFSFPVEKFVDVEREKNDDEELTHKEVEKDKDRPWNERQFVKIKFEETKILPVELTEFQLYESFGCIKETSSNLIDLQQDEASLNIKLKKTYSINPSADCGIPSSNTFSLDLKLSFLKKKENKTFKPRLYTKGEQKRIGFFKTTLQKFNKYNEDTQEDYAAHWDTSKKIIYYYSPNFPEKYKALIRKGFDNWNKTFKDPKVAKNALLEIRENTGQEPGDLRYNFIVWIDDPVDSGLLGYGPSLWDPFTGEIINANVYLFGGIFRQELQRVYDEKENSSYGKTDGPGSSSRTSERSDTQFASNSPSFKTLTSVNFEKDILDSPFTIQKYFKKKSATSKESVEDAVDRFRNKSGRCYYPVEIGENARTWYKQGLTEEEIFQRLVLDTLVHEMGHNFGLRHNFKGSVDKKHFISAEHQASTVMDYLDLEDSENGQPGPYDKEALSYVYTGKFNAPEKFLFCTDDQVLLDPFCNHFDRGTTATEIATHLANDYQKKYEYRNLKGRRLHFYSSNSSIRHYIRTLLLRYFFPLRQYLDYYFLVGEHGVTIDGVTLNKDEHAALLKDLSAAMKISFNFFHDIILNLNKSYEDVIDFEGAPDEILIRGTKIDKILATQLITMRELPFDKWDILKNTYFDVRELQNPMLELLTETTLDHHIRPLISFILAYRFMTEIPSIEGGADDPLARPSLQAAELFKINKVPLSKMTLDLTKKIPVHVIDEDEGMIYAAPAMMFTKQTPVAALIDGYKNLKETYEKFLTQFSDNKEGSETVASERFIKLEEIEQKLKASTSNDIASLSKEDLDLLNNLFQPSLIIATRDDLLSALKKGKKDFLEELKKSKDKDNDDVEGEYNDHIKYVSQLSKLQKLSELPKNKREALISFIQGQLMAENGVRGRVITSKKEILTALDEIKRIVMLNTFNAKRALDIMKFKINFLHMLYENRHVSLR